jgi:hypothetical protein
MSPGAKISVVVLFVLNFAMAGTAYLAAVGYYHREQASQQRQAAAQQAAQQHQGQVLEHRLCTTLNRLGALKPPPGNAGTNPSRGFDQKLYLTLAELGPDVGCPAVKP